MMILRVGLEVFGEIADAFAENGNLNFRRTGVGVVGAVRGDELGFSIFVQSHGSFTSASGPADAIGGIAWSPVRRNVLIPNE
jgi:hypothetical protein